MDEPLNPAAQNPPEPAAGVPIDAAPKVAPAAELSSAATDAPPLPAEWRSIDPNIVDYTDLERARRSFRRHVLALFGLVVAAFGMTALIFMRLGTPFSAPNAGPAEIVRAQLTALDRGQLHEAYNLFSARYRKQVSFDAWHELVVTHWRMFHTEQMRAAEPERWGGRVELEVHLRSADGEGYRARFTLVRADGRWWVDDIRWGSEIELRGFVRT